MVSHFPLGMPGYAIDQARHMAINDLGKACWHGGHTSLSVKPIMFLRNGEYVAIDRVTGY